jgi:hypothetical protein
MPIIKFLSKNAGSEPDSGRSKLGAFLVQVRAAGICRRCAAGAAPPARAPWAWRGGPQARRMGRAPDDAASHPHPTPPLPPQAQFQGSTQSSSLFVTAAAQNLLCLKLAAEMGAPIPDAWMTWFKGALVPSLVGLITIPWLIYKLCPPEVRPRRPRASRASRASRACAWPCPPPAAAWACAGAAPKLLPAPPSRPPSAHPSADQGDPGGAGRRQEAAGEDGPHEPRREGVWGGGGGHAAHPPTHCWPGPRLPPRLREGAAQRARAA